MLSSTKTSSKIALKSDFRIGQQHKLIRDRKRIEGRYGEGTSRCGVPFHTREVGYNALRRDDRRRNEQNTPSISKAINDYTNSRKTLNDYNCLMKMTSSTITKCMKEKTSNCISFT